MSAKTVRVVAFVGSLRAGSHNRQLAEAATRFVPDGTELTVFEGLADVPFYNEDIDVEGDAPAAAVRLREAAAGADAFLLFSPEYNGTMPAVLKNTIDWLSRPYGASAISGKPVAVIGTSFGRFGGSRAQEAARKAAAIAGAAVVEEIQLSIPESVRRFSSTHPADDPEVVEQLTKVLSDLTAAVPLSS